MYGVHRNALLQAHAVNRIEHTITLLDHLSRRLENYMLQATVIIVHDKSGKVRAVVVGAIVIAKIAIIVGSLDFIALFLHSQKLHDAQKQLFQAREPRRRRGIECLLLQPLQLALLLKQRAWYLKPLRVVDAGAVREDVIGRTVHVALHVAPLAALELRWVHLVKLVADGRLHGQLCSRRCRQR